MNVLSPIRQCRRALRQAREKKLHLRKTHQFEIHEAEKYQYPGEQAYHEYEGIKFEVTTGLPVGAEIRTFYNKSHDGNVAVHMGQ